MFPGLIFYRFGNVFKRLWWKFIWLGNNWLRIILLPHPFLSKEIKYKSTEYKNKNNDEYATDIISYIRFFWLQFASKVYISQILIIQICRRKKEQVKVPGLIWFIYLQFLFT